jgi:hypothetical protein
MYCIFILLQLNLCICNGFFFMFYIFYFVDSYHELMWLCVYSIFILLQLNLCICNGIFFMFYIYYFVDSYHECADLPVYNLYSYCCC